MRIEKLPVVRFEIQRYTAAIRIRRFDCITLRIYSVYFIRCNKSLQCIGSDSSIVIMSLALSYISLDRSTFHEGLKSEWNQL